MSFEDALKRVLDAAVQELTVLATDERNRAREQGADEGRAQGLKDGRSEGRAEGVKDGREEGRSEGLKDGREQGRAEAREEVARESQAALAAAVAAARAESAVSVAANTRLLAAIRTIDTARTLGEVLDALGTSAAAEANRAGILLVRDGRLTGWKFHGFGSSLANPSSVDLAMGETGTLADGREHVDVPLTVFGETVAILYADRSDAPSPGAWREAIEILGRHGARALEGLTAIKAARSVAGVKPSSVDRPPALDEPDDPDSSARRYAKLLVSEIKLYHEAAVVAGRRDRDLSSRLGGEISRARVLYEQRVPAAVRDRSDYFRDELVRTLANGDATLLRLT